MGFGFLTSKKRKQLMPKKKFFQHYDAPLSEEKLKNIGVGSIRTFSAEELEKATQNYASSRIIGRGYYGNVYMGILPDNCVIAIKKSRTFDPLQSEQFINELVMLSQINHQNVVQLLGCCLETEVPLLAYQYVSNGTLFEHIHNIESGKARLAWDSRLRIAHESASALAYLHTDTRGSLVHRDVKSTNILLDENLTAKLGDIGGSKLLPLGYDQITTLVTGTLGYLDPIYFQTSQLTDKSDVYSFGVVLAELLTGKKPRMESQQEERTLASYFLKAERENRLPEIIDNQVIIEATDEQLKEACDLACRCLDFVRGNRPSMKEVTMELGRIRKLGKHHLISEDNYDEPSI